MAQILTCRISRLLSFCCTIVRWSKETVLGLSLCKNTSSNIHYHHKLKLNSDVYKNSTNSRYSFLSIYLLFHSVWICWNSLSFEIVCFLFYRIKWKKVGSICSTVGVIGSTINEMHQGNWLKVKFGFDLCISGVCQQISNIFGDPLPVRENSNLTFNNVLGAFHHRVDCNYEHSGVCNM